MLSYESPCRDRTRGHIDSRAQTLGAYDGAARFFRSGERFEHPVLPGFSLDLAALFAQLTPS